MPGGIVIDVAADGTKTQTNGDGNIVQILPDGTFLEMGSVAELEAKKQAMTPVGITGGSLNSTSHFDKTKEPPPPKKWWQFGGPSKKELAEMEAKKKEEELVRAEYEKYEGSTSLTFASGIKQTKWPDGKTEQINPDGTTITILPDGTRTQKTPDGTTMTVTPDGCITQVDPDGKYIVSHVDASNPNGVSTNSTTAITFTHRMNQQRNVQSSSTSSHVVEGNDENSKFIAVSHVGKQKSADAGLVTNLELDKMSMMQLRNLGAQYGLTAEETKDDNIHTLKKKIKGKVCVCDSRVVCVVAAQI